MNLHRATPSTVLSPGDLVTHLTHHHEPPALDLPINKVYEDDELLVVDKPPGLVVHPIAGKTTLMK